MLLCAWHCWEGEKHEGHTEGSGRNTGLEVSCASPYPQQGASRWRGFDKSGSCAEKWVPALLVWFLECLKTVSFCRLQERIISNFKENPMCTLSDTPGHLSLIRIKKPRLRHLFMPLSKLILI